MIQLKELWVKGTIFYIVTPNIASIYYIFVSILIIMYIITFRGCKIAHMIDTPLYDIQYIFPFGHKQFLPLCRQVRDFSFTDTTRNEAMDTIYNYTKMEK